MNKDNLWIIACILLIFVAVLLNNQHASSTKPHRVSTFSGNTSLKDSISLNIRKIFLPDTKNIIVIRHKYYTIGFNDKYHLPNWVMYQLTPEMSKNLDTDIPRKNSFRKDPLINNIQGQDIDYYHSDYDKGHLCPAEDMDFNSSAMLETFYYTNIVPQPSGFNRGWWKQLENQVRLWATEDTVWVITGVIFGKKSIGNNINVPDFCYKIITKKDYSDMICFIHPNTKLDNDALYQHIFTVDELETYTQINFFKDLPLKLQSTVEKNQSKKFLLK